MRFPEVCSMKRLVWALFVSALLLLSMTVFPKAVHAEESGDFQFEVENATVIITTYYGSGPVVAIPEKINGMDVTRISKVGVYWDSRSKVDQIISLEIPKSVVDIQSDALIFCPNLTEIRVDPANEYYQSLDGLLYNKSKERLVSYPPARKEEQFVVPERVTNIDNYAFYNCKNLRQVTVKGPVKRIGKQAFGYCRELTNIILSEGIAQIDDDAFSGCIGLKALRLPASIESISPSAFSSCWQLEEIYVDPRNKHYVSHDGILFDKSETTLIKCPENRPGESYMISSGVQVIAESAFKNCKKLKRLDFPDSLKKIESNSFFDCQHLMELSIPDSVTIIGESAFSGCISLTTLKLPSRLENLSNFLCMGNSRLSRIDIPDSVLSIGDRSFAECEQLKSVHLPDGLQSIGDSAFMNCQQLMSVSIPSGIKQVMPGTFSGCKALTSIDLPSGIRRIGAQSFYQGTSLTQITIPDSVEEIGQEAFAYCSKLKSIQLPDRFTRLEARTLASCFSLSAISLTPQINSIASDAFESCINLRAIDVAVENQTYSSQDGILYDKAKSILIKYPEAATNRQFIIPDGVTEIESQAFIYSDNLNNVTIPVSIKRIGTEAFLFCSKLEYASFLGNAPVMGDDVFAYCDNQFTLYCHIGRAGFNSLGYPVQILKTGNLSVTFRDWNGAVLLADLVAFGQSAIAPADPARVGYSFSGWDKPFDSVQNDLTVTALYQANSASSNTKYKQFILIGSALLLIASGVFGLIFWKRRRSRLVRNKYQ